MYSAQTLAAVGLPDPPLPDPTTRWYESATVRHSARVMLSSTGDTLLPSNRQMLSTHPSVVAHGQDAVTYVLAQSVYASMQEIALLETKLVIECCLKIVNREIMPGASDTDRLDALTVVVDEAYHAHVAMDFIGQVQATTGIVPLPFPAHDHHLQALQDTRATLPVELQPHFELIAVFIAEHILIKDIVAARRDEKVAPAFTRLMSDHASDEGRHATFFADLTRACWAGLPEHARHAIGGILPGFLQAYTAGDESRASDRALLAGCGLRPAAVDAAIEETDPTYAEIMEMHVALTQAHLLRVMARVGILDHAPTRAAFVASGMLAA